MALLGFLGAGNMGSAMLSGALTKYPKSDFLFTTASLESKKKIIESFQIEAASDNKALVKDCHYVLLAVKPQVAKEVLEEIREVLSKEQILLSVVAGLSIEKIKERVGKSIRVIRAMPNTPAMVQEGMTALCFDESFYTKEEEKFLFNFFSSFGRYEIMPEKWINASMCASGSSPAFVYLLIESLADSAVRAGMPRKMAQTMAAQAVLGAAKMVLTSQKHPSRLKDEVCSPGGTTIEGIAALEEWGFQNAVMKAGEALVKRAKEMEEIENG